MLQYLVQLCLMQNTENISQCDQALLSNFPVDPCLAQKVLLLECQSTIFAICPKHSVSKATNQHSTLDHPSLYIQNIAWVITLATLQARTTLPKRNPRKHYICASQTLCIL